MIDPLTIADEPTARAHADMIFVESIERLAISGAGEGRIGAEREYWESLSWDQRKVKASEIVRRQRNYAD